jgi:hypothetical protein
VGIVLAGEDQHRQASARTDAPAGFHAPQTRQHQIEQHQIGATACQQLEALFSDVDSYQQQNTLGGLSTRASMNKVAKEKARDYQRGSKKAQP